MPFLALWHRSEEKKKKSLFQPHVIQTFTAGRVSYLLVISLLAPPILQFWANGEPERGFGKAPLSNRLSLIAFYGPYFDEVLFFLRCTVRCCTAAVIMPTP